VAPGRRSTSSRRSPWDRRATDPAAWVAADGSDAGSVVGFASVRGRYPRSADITFAAVSPHRRGAGIALVERTLPHLQLAGVDVVEVKTLDASTGYAP